MHKEVVTSFVNQKQCQSILSSLIKINSTHPQGNEMDVVKEIMAYFKPYPIQFDIIDHGNNRGSLMITLPGENSTQATAFIGHLDTVPIGDYDDWMLPPFEAEVVGNEMYGRGSADMKGGVTSMIMTALYLLEHTIKLAHDVKFCFTADEELNGMGVLAMKERGYLDNVIELFIPEPTNEQIGIAEKGALWLSIEVKGVLAHGSRPELGVNAIQHLLMFLQQFENTIDRTTEHYLLGKSTFSINQFEGGLQTNVIPAYAKASLDIRTLPNMNHIEIVNQANMISHKLMGKDQNLIITVSVENDRPAIETKKEHPFVKKVAKTCENLMYTPQYRGLYFYTDGSQVIPDFKIPFVILGPGDDAMAHVKNEKIAIQSVATVAEIFITYLLENNKIGN